MPQHLANFGKRRSLAQHIDSKSMAQLMRPGVIKLDPGALDRSADDLADVAARLQTVEGRPRAQKDPLADRFRSPIPQVGCNRLTDVMRQRQWPFLSTFAVHPQASLQPVDIAQ